MFALVPCVLFSDAFGHEIVPLFTLASPPARVHCPSTARRAGLFPACVSLRADISSVCRSVARAQLCGGGGGAEDGVGVGCQPGLSPFLCQTMQVGRMITER